MSGKTSALIVAVAIIAIAAVAVAVVVVDNNKAADCTVTYDLNYDGAPESTKAVYKDGTSIDQPTNINTTRTDYVFTGWYTEKACINAVEFPYKVTGDVTFYAKYIKGDVTSYFNAKFLESIYGKHLVNSEKETTGAVEFKPAGSEINVQYQSVGFTHIVFDFTDLANEYVVYTEGDGSAGFDDSEVFAIAETGSYGTIVDIRSITNLVSNYEFLIITNENGEYYIRDLQKTSSLIGPSTTEPSLVNNSSVVFNNVLYIFDDDKKLTVVGSVNTDHYPTTGDGLNTYGEIVTENDGGKVRTTGYILYSGLKQNASGDYVPDDKHKAFDVKYSFSYPDNAHRAVIFYLENDNYLVQYSYETTSGDYTYKEDGVKYILVSRIVDGLTGSAKIIGLQYPAFAESNMTLWRGFAAALNIDEGKEIANIISLKKVDSNKNLMTNGKLLVYIGSDGTIKKMMSLSLGNYSFAFMTPTAVSERYYIYYMDENNGDPIVHRGIVDAKFNVILYDLQQIACEKYFMLKADGDTNIYDINGNVVGNSGGKKVVGATNNVIFFTDDSNKLYRFANGTMTECSDYKGELVLGSGYYGYKTADKEYSYFAENGTFITKTNSPDVREEITLKGYHVVEFWVNASGVGSDIYGHTEFFLLKTGGVTV